MLAQFRFNRQGSNLTLVMDFEENICFFEVSVPHLQMVPTTRADNQMAPTFSALCVINGQNQFQLINTCREDHLTSVEQAVQCKIPLHWFKIFIVSFSDKTC